jgi:microcystin-dependent protein
MTLYKWSQTASSDATADSTINWSEGQAPSSINDSARAMMAATAKFRDDIAGAIVTGGTSTSYTVTSYQQFDSLAHLSGQVIAFTPHVTSTGSQCLLNVDGLGTKTVRLGTGIDVPAGTLIQGTPYEAVYNNLDGVFYLKGFYGSPYLIPLGATLDYWAPTAPNSTFVFPVGQAISRVTYATLFALMGTTHGTGDGSSTFNLPDLRGRVVASPDNMGGTDASRLSGSGITSLRTTLGGTGGEGSHTLAASEIPSITSTGTVNVTVSSTRNDIVAGGPPTNANVGGANLVQLFPPSSAFNTSITSTGSGTASVGSNNTGSAAHNNVQPTILGNRIMRII